MRLCRWCCCSPRRCAHTSACVTGAEPQLDKSHSETARVAPPAWKRAHRQTPLTSTPDGLIRHVRPGSWANAKRDEGIVGDVDAAQQHQGSSPGNWTGSYDEVLVLGFAV